MNDLFQALAGSPPAFIACLGILGLMVGSFLNVVVHRLPLMMERDWRAECAEVCGLPEPAPAPPFNLVFPRSRCPQCATPIAGFDNIPVLSWLVLRGRCRHCSLSIALRYPLVELAGGMLGAVAAWHFGFGLAALLGAGLSWALLALALIDLDTFLLPDSITLPLLWAGLAAALFGVFVDLHTAVIGAMVGYLSLWSVYWLFRLATGKEGMGFGDFKLLAALGAWLGWEVLPGLIVGAAAVGAVAGLGAIAFGGHERGKPMPFGPFLAAAGWIYLIWGQPLQAALFRMTAP